MQAFWNLAVVKTGQNWKLVSISKNPEAPQALQLLGEFDVLVCWGSCYGLQASGFSKGHSDRAVSNKAFWAHQGSVSEGSVSLCICLLTKCFTGMFPGTLNSQAELCWVGGCREEGKCGLCIIGLSSTSPSHKRCTRCTQTWPACPSGREELSSWVLWMFWVHFPRYWEKLVSESLYPFLPSGLSHLYLRFQTISKDLGFNLNKLCWCLQGRNAHVFLLIYFSYERIRIAKLKLSPGFFWDGEILFLRAKCRAWCFSA